MKDLHGFAIGASDGDIGTVKECYFDDVSYTVRYVVVDTGGWLSERKVLLSPIALRAMDWEHKRITAALTKAQVEKSPDIDTDKPVSRQHEAIYYGYYGYDPYWSGPYLWGASPYPFLGSGPALNAADLERERRWNWEAKERANPHLRSSRAVTGYHIQATDGDHRPCGRLPRGRPLMGDPLPDRGHEQLVGRQEGTGCASLGRPGGLGPFEGAREHHARADQEQSRARSSPAC
jgi:hypothetical protein